MKFSVVEWNAVSACCQNKQAWQHFFQLENQDALSSEITSMDLSFLPAMKRRRLSSMARLVFAAAWPLLPEEEMCPVVFVSFDGEVNRSLQLWHELLTDNHLSPTSFALSVHNAVLGQWSLFRGDTCESTALSTRDAALEVGVVEACGLLSDGAEKVMVIIADDPIEHDGISAHKAPFAYALVLLLEAGNQISLTLQEKSPDCLITEDTGYYHSPFAWIKNQLGNQNNWSLSTTSGLWQWHCQS